MESLTDYFGNQHHEGEIHFDHMEIHSCPDLIERVNQLGVLPLLDSGISGFCAEGLMAEECRFVQFDDGSWEWPLWTWKSSVIKNADAFMASFSPERLGLSVLTGGPTSTTGAAARHPFWKKAALRKPLWPPCR